MKRYGAVLVVIVAAGTAAIGYWQSNKEQAGVSTKSPPAADLAAQLEGLRSEVVKLRRESHGAATMAALAVTASERATAESTRAAPNASATADGEGDTRRNERTREEERAVLDRRLASEPIDRSWSRDTEDKIRDVIRLPSVHGDVTEVKCGSTLCRAVVESANTADQQQLARHVVGQEPFARGAEYYYDTSADRYVTTVYAVREGHAFIELANK